MTRSATRLCIASALSALFFALPGAALAVGSDATTQTITHTADATPPSVIEVDPPDGSRSVPGTIVQLRAKFAEVDREGADR